MMVWAEFLPILILSSLGDMAHLSPSLLVFHSEKTI
jgi:hypothetical protein